MFQCIYFIINLCVRNTLKLMGPFTHHNNAAGLSINLRLFSDNDRFFSSAQGSGRLWVPPCILSINTGGCVSDAKTDRAWNLPLTSVQYRSLKNTRSCVSTPSRFSCQGTSFRYWRQLQIFYLMTKMLRSAHFMRNVSQNIAS